MSLSVENLFFAYGAAPVLRDVSFTAEGGELVSVLGPNGVGKTTLFRCILGTLTPQMGHIKMDGQDLATLPPRERARRIAYIPQIHPPTFGYTVLDTVLMGAARQLNAFQQPGAAQIRQADEALEQVGATHLRERNFAHLSGGEQQLVLIARALALLAENCRKRGAANIDIRCGDIARLPPEQPYDAMVFCFFGHIEEILTISAAQCRGTVLAVMRNDGCHRFSAAQGAVRHGGYPRGAAELTARGIPFHAVERELPMGQPFRTIDDARRFFQLYRRPDDTTPVTDDFLRQRLTATGREDFPLYLPQNRRFGLLRWETCEIPNQR